MKIDKFLTKLIIQKREFQKGFYGINREDTSNSEEKIKKMYEKYGDDFSLECTAIAYTTLTGQGKIITKKSLPLGVFFEELQGRKILIDSNVLALEVFCKGAWYDKDGKKHILGGSGQNGMLFCNKVVFGKNADVSRLGYFADALVCTKEEFSSFCKFFAVADNKNKQPDIFEI